MSDNPNLLSSNYSQQASLPNATASLVLGIISIVGAFCYGIVGVICGIIGLVLANKDRKMYQATPDIYSSSSYSTVNSGRICSIIGLIIGSIILLFFVIAIIFFGSLSMETLRQLQQHQR